MLTATSFGSGNKNINGNRDQERRILRTYPNPYISPPLVEVLRNHYHVRRTSNAATATWESNQEFMDSLATVKENEVRHILTDEQFARWEQQEDQYETGTTNRQQAIKEASEMKERLQLTENQTQALEELTFQHLQYIERMEGVQRGSGQLKPRVFLRAKSEYRSALSEILSAEQFEKWKSLSGDTED